MKRKFMWPVFAAMMATTSVLFLTGCGGGDDDNSTPANVAGTYNGTVRLSGYGLDQTTTTSAKINQDGTAVSGNMGAFAISGVVEGNNVNITGKSGGATLALNLTMDGETLSGSGTTSLSGYTFDAQVTLNRISAKSSGVMSPAYDATEESTGVVSGAPGEVLKTIIKDMQAE
ncbi:MAG: hypothetical protein WC381_10020 [Kiritimatiellia bacterium]